jgi:hypothetical protein
MCRGRGGEEKQHFRHKVQYQIAARVMQQKSDCLQQKVITKQKTKIEKTISVILLI